MHTLIAFATQWGSKFGGINSFNTDFLSAFGVAYHSSVQVVCIVASATQQEVKDARNAHVRLIPLLYPPPNKLFTPAEAQAGIDELKRQGILFDASNTVWLGHDRITGAAANAAVNVAGGRAALIHHMSYDHYESYAENSESANEKKQGQRALFQKADIVLAIGPLLRDAASDLIAASKKIFMLIPGLAEIEPRSAPKTFTAFLSGRLNDNATAIKQGHLGIAAFAKAHREACDNEMPDGLCNQPKLVLRGVDFESQLQSPKPKTDPEIELKQFAEEYAKSVINLHALPYTLDRQVLYADLSSATVAMMPSWHEGFGLVAWEAIAAGVPIIISKESGVYRLLKENHPGTEIGFINSIDVRGTFIFPFFRPEDLKATVAALKVIAHKPEEARKKSGMLRSMLDQYTWSACAEQAVKAFGWNIQKGSIAAVSQQQASSTKTGTTFEPPPVVLSPTLLQMPLKLWKAGIGMADSRLLRAEEALVPFDPARQTELHALNTWIDNTQWPLAVRLITGAGGLGKTRLALELCKKRIESGWHSGLLATELEVQNITSTWHRLRSIDQPLLIVIDYAETRQTILLALIKAIMKSPGTKPVRILLLARDSGEWWDNLPSKDAECEPLLSGYATSGPFVLPALHVTEHDRSKAYQQALIAFSEALDVSAPDVIPELTGEHFERPLYVQMAALLALYGERPTTAEGLSRALLSHEKRYWIGLLAHLELSKPEEYAQQLLALTTLAGGFATAKDGYTFWKKINFNSLSASDFTTLFQVLASLYPGQQGLQAMRPDLLGEALVAQTLFRPETDNLLDTVLSNSASQQIRRNALTVLTRLSSHRIDLQEIFIVSLVRHFANCCQDVVAVAIQSRGNLSALAEIAFVRLELAVKSQVSGLLIPLFKTNSVQLSQLACAVTGFLAEKSRSKLLKKTNNDALINYANALDRYSMWLSRSGRNEQACTYEKEAVDISESLYQADQKQYDYSHALFLLNYAQCLSEADQNEKALNQAKQAIDIVKVLMQKKPDKYEANYALLLSNYSSYLNDTGQIADALVHAKQALVIRQRLSGIDAKRYEDDYAMSLGNYSNFMSAVGQYKDALDYGKKVVDIYMRLAQEKPDEHEPNYAKSLGNFANRLSDTGQYAEAINFARNAASIRKRLAEKNPVRFDAEFLSSIFLVSLLNWLCDRSDDSEASVYWDAVPMSIPPYLRTIILLYAAFVKGCWTTDQIYRSEMFTHVLSIWNNLSVAYKTESEEYRLSAAAWCASFAPEAVSGSDWRTSWHRYLSQRQGKINHSMVEFAQRLKFQWPVL